MKKLLNESYALVQLDEENNTIEIIWKKFAMSRQYRQAIETAYNAVVTYRVSNWFSDMTNAGAVAMEDQKWIQEEMIPKSIEAGVRKIAVVVSTDVFSQIFLNSIDTKLPAFTKEHFDNAEDARKWIKREMVFG